MIIEKTMHNYCGKLEKKIRIISFIENMNEFYSAADIIISRSGAIALSEMTFLGKAMVLIPLPHSAGNHQFINAKSIEKKWFCNTNSTISIKIKPLREINF